METLMSYVQGALRRLHFLRGESVSALLARGGGGVFAVKIVGTGLAFGMHVFLARMLGVDSYGIYTYVTSWAYVLVALSMMGMRTTSLRFIPEYCANTKWGLMRGFIRRSQQMIVGASTLVALVLAGVVWWLHEQLAAELIMTFLIACPMLPVTASLMIRSDYLLALKRPVIARAPDLIMRPIILVGVFMTLWAALGRGLQAPETMLAQLAAIAVTLVIVSGVFSRTMPEQVRKSTIEYESMTWVRVSLPLMLNTGLYIVYNQVDILMVGALLGTSQAGIYSAATKIVELLTFSKFAIHTLAAALISEFYSQGKIDEVKHTVTLAARYTLYIALPIFLFIIIAGGWILSLFNPEFLAAYDSLIILSIGYMVSILAGPVAYLLVMSGNQLVTTKVLSISALLNVVLNAVLIPHYGLNGAATATAISIVFQYSALLWAAYRKVGINSTVFSFKSPRGK